MDTGMGGMPKRINRLTTVQIASLKKRGMYADGNGLYLQLSEAGTKSWVFRFRHQGKRRDMGLGAVVDVSLASARAKALEARRLLLQGIDPINSRTAARASARIDQITFRQSFEIFFEVKRKSLSNAKHLGQWPSGSSMPCGYRKS